MVWLPDDVWLAQKAAKGKGGGKTHITDDASRDSKYSEATDSKCRHLLTTGLCDSDGHLVAVLQLRDRLWRHRRESEPGLGLALARAVRSP